LALVADTTETLLGVATPSTVAAEAEEEPPPPPPPKSLQPDINAKITRTKRTLRALKNDLAI
jgi:predicted transcriptional regulator